MELLNIESKIYTVDAKEVHAKLGVKTKYTMWISRIIEKYGFVNGKDFIPILGKSIGGRKPISYHVTLDMAKHLCILDPSEIGMKIRDSYIELEKSVYKKDVIRLSGIETRKSLTEKIKDVGENERMHGHGYSNYTKMVYQLANIEYKKVDNFRDTLTAEQLDRVKTIEKMVDALLSIGKQYNEIKYSLSEIIKVKEIA
jgi:phage anti-repressor protein